MELIEYKKGTGNQVGGKSVCALGFFDGVHIAHRKLLSFARGEAKRRSLTSAVFTFSAGDIKRGVPMIYSTEDKLSLIGSCGIDRALVADFSELSGLSAEEFVRDVLVGALGCVVAVCGFNFRFGRGAVGDSEMLNELMRRYGGECIVVPEERLFGKTVSSTLIRSFLSSGRVDEANEALGEPYFIRGSVEHGLGIGRKNGLPTVNTSLGGAIIKNGVYRTEISLDGGVYPAITNVGTCPTYGERAAHAESYLIDYSGDLYGKEITIKFLGYLREEKKFDSEKELIMQINIDKDIAKELYRGKK